MNKNKIGDAIYYFRKQYGLSQGQLCKGICSVPTLSRIELGARNAEHLITEAILQRLGKSPNKFELIIDDRDYNLYLHRELIESLIKEEKTEQVKEELIKYQKQARTKKQVHQQFVKRMEACIYYIETKDAHGTIELLREAIHCTFPEFSEGLQEKCYLSYTEINIILEIAEMENKRANHIAAEKILVDMLNYLEKRYSEEENGDLYPKIACRLAEIILFLNREKDALEVCKKGLDKIKTSRGLKYRGELLYMEAHCSEVLYKREGIWGQHHSECLELYLEAYYVLEFCEEAEKSAEIRNHLEEEPLWENIV